MSPDHHLVEEGRQRLAELLPAAIEEAKNEGLKVITGTAPASGLAAHLTMANFHSLIVHEGEQGGWVVDLMLKDMPPGVPSVLGTPVATPHKTRDEAVEMAPKLLAYMTKLAMSPKEKPVAPVFEYFDVNVTMVPTILEAMVAAGMTQQVESSYCVGRLNEVSKKYFPEGATVEKMDALNHDQRKEVLVVLHMASAMGMFRYPEPEAKPPE